ncbi:hypothetical protein NMY22_g7440 [Coprinellus aureogranulatus]|nr:hypothetical protein NMY22_g7440 [Coprinellus aureogranulatus]
MFGSKEPFSWIRFLHCAARLEESHHRERTFTPIFPSQLQPFAFIPRFLAPQRDFGDARPLGSRMACVFATSYLLSATVRLALTVRITRDSEHPFAVSPRCMPAVSEVLANVLSRGFEFSRAAEEISARPRDMGSSSSKDQWRAIAARVDPRHGKNVPCHQSGLGYVERLLATTPASRPSLRTSTLLPLGAGGAKVRRSQPTGKCLRLQNWKTEISALFVEKFGSQGTHKEVVVTGVSTLECQGFGERPRRVATSSAITACAWALIRGILAPSFPSSEIPQLDAISSSYGILASIRLPSEPVTRRIPQASALPEGRNVDQRRRSTLDCRADTETHVNRTNSPIGLDGGSLRPALVVRYFILFIAGSPRPYWPHLQIVTPSLPAPSLLSPFPVQASKAKPHVADADCEYFTSRSTTTSQSQLVSPSFERSGAPSHYQTSQVTLFEFDNKDRRLPEQPKVCLSVKRKVSKDPSRTQIQY